MRVVFDLEIYQNYFLALFVFEDGKGVWSTLHNDIAAGTPLRDIAMMLQECTSITFNGRRYDMPLLSLAINGATNAELKAASDRIIQDGIMWWILENDYGFRTLDVDHIDIINLLPLYESLKIYGARNGTSHVQDLPYPPESIIDDDKAAELFSYCRKDCQVTWELFVSQWENIQLRMSMGEMYDMDLRSKSDAQIAEAVMISEYANIMGTRLIKPIDSGLMPTSVLYTCPGWVKFNDPELCTLRDDLSIQRFDLHHNNGKPLAPDWMKGKTVTIDNKKYAVGLGGLHAKNKAESHWSGSRGQLIDIDVTSYYPAIILNEGYAPPHMGEAFTRIYGSLVEQRLEAKRSGDKVAADALKITINGTYGKLGSRYSAVYAPELLLSVTFTGQLALLMLIEMMAEKGIQCVSANTDGVTVLSTISTETDEVVRAWERITGFNMEYTPYRSIHYRDVNNYFAETMEGEIKTKGVFKPPAINKNPSAPIVFNAAINYILYGQSISTAIEECNDIHQFLSVRKVAGGAAKDGEYLGKAVRWYYSDATDTAIHYISNGNMVAKSQGGMPMMDIVPGLPSDLDLNWYVEEAHKTLEEVGYFPWM